MNYLFYAEGDSEEKFVEIFLRQRRKGIKCIKVVNQFLNQGGYFLRNCKGDSNIVPALKKDTWWINKTHNSLIVVIADTDSLSCCYTKFKEEFKKNLRKA